MSKYQYQDGPETPDLADREKELSGQFEDPGLDFLFAEDQAS